MLRLRLGRRPERRRADAARRPPPWSSPLPSLPSAPTQANAAGPAPPCGSSLARVIRRDGLAKEVVACARTEETRKNVVKLLKQRSEESKVAIRNVRRDAQEDIRKLEKEGDCSEDDSRRAMGELQKLTDDSIKVIDQESAAKESEIMQV